MFVCTRLWGLSPDIYARRETLERFIISKNLNKR